MGLKTVSFIKKNKGLPIARRKEIFDICLLLKKCHTSVETSLFSNALEACVNEIDNSQEKDEKRLECIENNYLENFVSV